MSLGLLGPPTPPTRHQKMLLRPQGLQTETRHILYEVSQKGTNRNDPVCREPKMDFLTSHLTHHFHALDVGCWSMGSQYTPPTSLAPTETATWGRTDDPKPPDRHHSAGQVPDRPRTDHLSDGQIVCPGSVRSSVRRTDDLSATCPGVCPHFFHFFPFMSYWVEDPF